MMDTKRTVLDGILGMLEEAVTGELPTGDPLIDKAWNTFRGRVRDAVQEARAALSSGD